MGLLDKVFVRPGPMQPETRSTEPSQLELRVSHLGLHDLPGWAEQSLYAIGKDLVDWRARPTEVELIEDALAHAQTVTVALRELRRRAEQLVPR